MSFLYVSLSPLCQLNRVHMGFHSIYFSGCHQNLHESRKVHGILKGVCLACTCISLYDIKTRVVSSSRDTLLEG